MTKAKAAKHHSGVAADTWLASWGAFGQAFDNVVWKKGRPIRIDNGGALLFRAHAGRKSKEALEKLTEVEGFFNPHKNFPYANVMDKANVRVVEALGDNWLKGERATTARGKKSGSPLRTCFCLCLACQRASALPCCKLCKNVLRCSKGCTRQVRTFAKLPEHQRTYANAFFYRRTLKKVQDVLKQRKEGTRKLSNPELVATYGYTNTDYIDINQALRGLLDKGRKKALSPQIKTIEDALNKLPKHQGPVNRGTNLSKSAEAEMQTGGDWRSKGFTSTSTGKGSSGTHRSKIQSLTGRDIAWLSMYDHEKEILFKPNTKFYVVNKKKVGEETHITLWEKNGSK